MPDNVFSLVCTVKILSQKNDNEFFSDQLRITGFLKTLITLKELCGAIFKQVSICCLGNAEMLFCCEAPEMFCGL